MKRAIVELESLSTYSQGKRVMVDKKDKESPEDYEKRTWKEKCHFNQDGYVVIPPMSFANCIKEAAKYLSISIPGEGKSKYTKHFASGIICTEPLVTQTHKDDLQHQWVFVPSDGTRGGSKRVDKCFPIIPKWKGTQEFLVLDNKITEEIFTRVLKESGNIIGIGRFRPSNWGYFGRFSIKSVRWIDDEDNS